MSKQSASEILAAKVEADIAAGEDPLGDNDPLDVEAEGGSNVEAAAGDGADLDEEGEAGTDAGDGDAAADGEAADSEGAEAGEGGGEDAPLSQESLESIASDEPDITAFEVEKVDFKAKRADLATKEGEIDEKWTAGQMTDTERNKQLAALRDERDELTRQQTRAETIEDLNRQQLQSYQVRVLRNIASTSKKAGQLDYGDAKVGKAFDGMLQAVAADPDNDGKAFHELAQLAHEALCASRGVKATAAPAAAAKPAGTPAATSAPAARTAPKPPLTLRGLPAASTPHTGGNALDQLTGLKGQDFQTAFNRLSPAQQALLLDA